MNALSIVLWITGIVLIGIGYSRARGPWSRYRALRDQQANVDRYEAWRGGVRTPDDGPTGASVAMGQARRDAQVGAVIGVIGFVLVFLGFFVS